MELREDVTLPEMGNFRWLTVEALVQPDVAITLMAVPGPPIFEAETQEQLQELVARASSAACSSRRTTSTPPSRS